MTSQDRGSCVEIEGVYLAGTEVIYHLPALPEHEEAIASARELLDDRRCIGAGRTGTGRGMPTPWNQVAAAPATLGSQARPTQYLTKSRAGTGGRSEAALSPNDLRMYLRYAELQGWQSGERHQ